MNKEIWRENKERYDELNPREAWSSKVMWAIAALIVGIGAGMVIVS